MTDRFSRQDQLIPASVRDMTVHVIGLGMGGSWTAHAVSRIVGNLHIWDGDKVGEENLGTQAYDIGDVDINKSLALTGRLQGVIASHVIPFRARENFSGSDVVVACVDTMSGRRLIAEKVRDANVPLLIDCRAQGEFVALLCVTPDRLSEYLNNDLPTDAEVPAASCGMQGTAYVGMWQASQVAALINRFGRGEYLPYKTFWHVGQNQGWSIGKEGEEETVSNMSV